MNKLKNWLKKEKNKYLTISIWFLFLQIIIFIENYYVYEYNIILWFCDHAPLLFAIGFFFKNKDIIKSIINFGFLTQFIWIIDFIAKIFFNINALGITTYMFEGELGNFVIVPLLIHIFSTNLALIFTYKNKPTKKALIYSAIYIIIIYILTLSFTPLNENVNCIKEICGTNGYSFSFYTLFWPILVFITIVLPTHFIQYLLYKYNKKRKT